MAEYKSIKGYDVQSYAADPVATAAWTTSGALNTGRQFSAGAGTTTAGLVAGGADDPLGYTDTTEEFNGTAWTEVTAYPASRTYLGSAGSQTAALYMGGGSPPTSTSFHYDGTNWTAGGSMGTAIKQGAATGTQTAAFYCGGEAPALTTATEKYNGSTWSSSGAMNTARNNNMAFGIQTDGVTVGGGNPDGPNVWKAEEYNGTSWSIGNLLNTGRANAALPGGGTSSSDGMIVGGYSPSIPSGGYTAATEKYNGTTWSTGTSMPIATSGSQGSRSPTSSYFVTGGDAPSAGSYRTATFILSENSEPSTFLQEGQTWYNTASGALKYYDGSTTKTVTAS